MKHSLRRLTLLATLGTGFGLGTLPSVLEAAPPEYLSAEQPAGLPLPEEILPVDLIGEAPTDYATRDLIRIPILNESIVKLSPRSYYLYRDNDDGTKLETFALGGSAGFVSGWLGKSVRFGVTGYTSRRIHGPQDRDGAGLLRSGQKDYTVLGELYAEARHGPFSLKIGRQELDLPYLNVHDIRMTPNTFETAILDYSGEQFRAGIAHTWRMKFRNSSDFVSMSERVGAGPDRGVTTIGARYEFVEGSSVGFINHYGWDTFNTFYTEASWLQPLDHGLDLKLSAQFTDQRSVGDELIGDFDAQHFGAKASAGYKSLTASAMFTWYSRDSLLINPWGGTPTYNSIIVGDFNRPGEKAFGLGLSYDFANLGLEGFSAFSTVVFGDTPDAGRNATPSQNEYDLTVDYRIGEGLLKNLWLRGRVAYIDGDDRNRRDYRFIANYTFSF